MAAVTFVVVVVVVLVLVIMVMAAPMVMVMVIMVVIVVVMVGTELSVLTDHLGELMAFAAPVVVVVMVVVVLVLVIMVAAALVVVIIVVVIIVVVVVLVLMMVVVIVVVLEGFLVDVVIETGVVDGVDHPVGELVLVHVEYRAHEVELHDIVAGEGAMVLHTVVHVDEVEGEARTVLEIDRGLDVAEEASGFALNVLPDGHEGIRHPGLGIRIPVLYGPGEARGHAASLVKGRPFVILAHAINS